LTEQVVVAGLIQIRLLHSNHFTPVSFPPGANYVANATLFPQQINLAATFNVELARSMGRITAKVCHVCVSFV
jgi:beta-glucosidase-like glycosyl hydrolase